MPILDKGQKAKGTPEKKGAMKKKAAMKKEAGVKKKAGKKEAEAKIEEVEVEAAPTTEETAAEKNAASVEGQKRKRNDESSEEPKKKKGKIKAKHGGVKLEGDLLAIHLKREEDNCARNLLISTNPPPITGALTVRVRQYALCVAEFKTKAEALKRKEELEEEEGVKMVKHPEVRKGDRLVNPMKLYIEYVPEETTEEDLKEAFPTAKAINFNSERRYANPIYETKEEAEKVFREKEDFQLKGIQLAVLFSNKG
ncbi:uncharacterized protein LOC125035995 [Penaeus chinensis]|uniref:uncharacterized protein LOC125035995 n=1 Tax=Penaeus chinensis TaxID=139456 RepID=UPI001FB7A277|nr:uncharacterized protein LOC125035995 [Penaeus chinensis]XP_047484286.1 uncharacterized protein LOC125035995 [Penaeus chinensis]